MVAVRLVALLCVVALAQGPWLPAQVPVIYTSDLFHPHDDPDDHYDLATLFALPELDVRSIVIDMANHRAGAKQPGVVALRQMFHLTGRTVTHAIGLAEPLAFPDDAAREQREEYQGGVELILSTLHASEERVHVFTVGSLLDVAAAYNREPELLREKVAAIHVNAGTGPDGYQEEWNVRLDPAAYRRVMLSGLPIVWYPCSGRDGFRTWFRVEQSEILGGCAGPLRAFFEYALGRSTAEPIAFLDGEHPAPKGPRNMWCTAAFVELSGRRVYATARGFEALAAPPTADAEPVDCYRLRPVALTELDGDPPAPETGVYARYVGRDEDRIGQHDAAPDGRPDCAVQVHRLPAGKAIASARIDGPRDGVWQTPSDGSHWLVGTSWEGPELAVCFSHWADGSHRLLLTFDDGAEAEVGFHVPLPGSPRFAATMDVEGASVRVLEQRPGYGEVMTSCLKNLLEAGRFE